MPCALDLLIPLYAFPLRVGTRNRAVGGQIAILDSTVCIDTIDVDLKKLAFFPRIVNAILVIAPMHQLMKYRDTSSTDGTDGVTS